MRRIPLIEDLTTGPVPPGSNILVEFDPPAQWYNASLTITEGWLRTGGRIAYNASVQPLANVRAQLSRLGVDVGAAEGDERLELWDWYTGALGLKSTEQHSPPSLKVGDLSIAIITPKTPSEEVAAWGLGPDFLILWDDAVCLDRFNEARAWVELLTSRMMARTYVTKSSFLFGVMKGLQDDWVYKRLEAASEGVVEFKLDETIDPPRNLIRIKSMRNVSYDGRWHALKVGENFDVALER